MSNTTDTSEPIVKKWGLSDYLFSLFIISIVSFFSWFFYMMYNYETYRTWELTTEETCKKQLPAGYSVAYNPDTKKYAIKITYEYIHYIKYFGKSSTVYSSFSDSCIAKAFCFAYLEDIQEQASRNNFK